MYYFYNRQNNLEFVLLNPLVSSVNFHCQELYACTVLEQRIAVNFESYTTICENSSNK